MVSAASALVATGWLSMATMMSPALRPADAAGELGVTVVIWAPPFWAAVIDTPRKPLPVLVTVPFFRESTSGMTRSIGMAKAMLWPLLETAVLMPITWPLASASGPPELPGLMAASVWIRPVSRSPLVCSDRLSPEMMPVVTDGQPGARPRALPTATTGSPTWRPEDLPILTGVRGPGFWIWMTAM